MSNYKYSLRAGAPLLGSNSNSCTTSMIDSCINTSGSTCSQPFTKRRRTMPNHPSSASINSATMPTIVATIVSRAHSFNSNDLQDILRNLNRSMMGGSPQQRRVEVLEDFFSILQQGLSLVSSSSSLSDNIDNEDKQEMFEYARPIHGALLLHWGYILSSISDSLVASSLLSTVSFERSQEDSPIANPNIKADHDQAVLALLCQCVHCFYMYIRRCASTTNCDKRLTILDITEYAEVAELVLCTLERQQQKQQQQQVVTNEAKAATTACLEVAFFLATGLSKDHSAEFSKNEGLLMCLVRIVSSNDNTHAYRAMQILEHLSRQEAQRQESVPGSNTIIVCTAARIIRKGIVDGMGSKAKEQISSMCTLFHTEAGQKDTTMSTLNNTCYELGCQLLRMGKIVSNATLCQWEELLLQPSAQQQIALHFIRCLSFNSTLATRLVNCHRLVKVLYILATSVSVSANTSLAGADESSRPYHYESPEITHMALPLAASECLSSLAINCQSRHIDGSCNRDFTSKGRTQLVYSLASVVCQGDMAIKRKAIPGLCFLVNQDNVKALMNTMDSDSCDRVGIFTCKQLLDALEEIWMVSEQQDYDPGSRGVRLGAVKLIMKIVFYAASNQSRMSAEYCLALHSITSLLSSAHDVSLIGAAVEMVHKLAKDVSLRQHLAGHDDEVLIAMSLVISNEFSSVGAKLHAVEAIWYLAEERTNLPILPRIPGVLDALVSVASTSPTLVVMAHTDDSSRTRERTRRLSLKILVKFATLVSNRRVLARQVGLLSCLIRYVRFLSDDNDDDGSEKNEMKEHILKLAVLL